MSASNQPPLFSRGAWRALLAVTVVSVLLFGLCLLLALLQVRDRTLRTEPFPTLAFPTLLSGSPGSPGTSDPGLDATPAASPAPGWTPSPTTIAPMSGVSGRIVFTCTRDGYSHICIINADGSGLLQLTDGETSDSYPALGSDGYVYFVSRRSSPSTLYRVPAKGGALQAVLTDMSLGKISAPELSPDGSLIVFSAHGDESDQILSVRPDGAGLLYLVGSGRNLDPTWSPDGLRIAYASIVDKRTQIYVMAADGDLRRQVTSMDRVSGRPSFSADGLSLAFEAGPEDDRDIYLVEIATGVVTRLTDGGNNVWPCYSPDGKYIVFASSRDGDFDLYVMRADGSGTRPLTDNLNIDDWQPRWGR